jgi:hypothetical protein
MAAARPKGDRMLAALLQEARLALRAIVHQPLTGAIVIVTLALGLGANIATFGMIDALILRPFTIPEVDRLVMPSENSTDDPYAEETIAPAGTLAYGQPWQSLSGAASYGWWDVNLSGGSEPERVLGFRVSGEFFTLLGVTPARGRLLASEDMTYGRHRQIVMADGLWKRRFNADPPSWAAIQLDGEPYEVVGIAPAGFTFRMAPKSGAAGVQGGGRRRRPGAAVYDLHATEAGRAFDAPRRKSGAFNALRRLLRPTTRAGESWCARSARA